jgi:hypothetical protein
MPVRPQGRDWVPLIVVAVATSVVLAGGGFLGGYGVGYAVAAQHKAVANTTTPTPEPTSAPFATESPTPTPTPSPAPTPTPAVDCNQFGDFPYYPGSRAVESFPQETRAWHVDAPAGQVAIYFGNGANQLAWQFRLSSATSTRWTYRISRAPSCRGALVVMIDPNGGTLYQAIPTSQ